MILHGEDWGTNQLPAGDRPNSLFRWWQLVDVQVCWPREHLSIDIHKVVGDLGLQTKSQGVVLPLRCGQLEIGRRERAPWVVLREEQVGSLLEWLLGPHAD